MSTTAVPLRPIAKGSLTRLWIGVAAAVLAAGGLAYASYPRQVATLQGGVRLTTLKAGEGASPAATDVVLIDYKGTLPDGTVFDEQKRAPLEVNGVVPGFAEGLRKMQKGGRYRLWIPAELAYGAEGGGTIPPNTPLTFEISLHEFKTRAEIQAMQQQMMLQQQMMQQQQGAGAPPPAGR